MLLKMVGAEAKKLTKRRGVMTLVIVATIGAVVLVFGITEAFHLADPAKYGPVGGTKGMDRMMAVLGHVALIPAAVIGATAGSQDVESGVIRDLFVTGRSRQGIFLLRNVGAAVVWIPNVVIAYVLGIIGVFAFTTGVNPSTAEIFGGLGYVVGVTLSFALVSLGVSTLFGSRGPAIAVSIGWIVVAEGILANITYLGRVRDAFFSVAAARLQPAGPGGGFLAGLHPALGIAILTIVAWTVIAFILGAWRTTRLAA